MDIKFKIVTKNFEIKTRKIVLTEKQVHENRIIKIENATASIDEKGVFEVAGIDLKSKYIFSDTSIKQKEGWKEPIRIYSLIVFDSIIWHNIFMLRYKNHFDNMEWRFRMQNLLN